MQQNEGRILKPFINYYCDALPCGVGEYYLLKADDERRLSEGDIKVLCEVAISKNVLAGVRELYLKLPHYIDISDLFDKYKINGKIILPATEIALIPTKALVGNGLIIEIQDFSDLSDGLLNDIANFVGDEDIPVLLNLGDDLTEVGRVTNKFHMSPTELAESYGFLDRKCFVRGLNHVDKDDLNLVKNYNGFALLTPRSDAREGRGMVNIYHLINNQIKFGFGSGKCYNIDMIAEGRLSVQNTCSLLSDKDVIGWRDISPALSCGEGQLQIPFDEDMRDEVILEMRVNLGEIEERLIQKVKEIVRKLKEKK